jgi:hypothetical protein
MTMLGSRKVNKKGRSTGQLKTNARLKIGAQFVAHTIEMLESPAWGVLSQSARRILDRIEIEHMRHGAVENGRLPVTFDDFANYGVERHAISPAIRELEALGLIEITQRGRAGNADFRQPNIFRLTYLHKYQSGQPATHEWRQIETIEDAQTRARNARHTKGKKQNPSAGKPTYTSAGKPTTNARFHSGKPRTTAMVGNPALLSISPGEWALREWSTPTLTEITMDEYSATVPRKRGKPVLRIAK